MNIPIGDDFPAFVDLTPDAVDGHLSLSRFFSQINEHRILYDRIFWIGGLWLFSAVNFKILLLIGNFSLILFVLFFNKIGKELQQNGWMTATMACLFLSWVGYSNSLCSMMALQNFTFPLMVCAGLWMMSVKQDLKGILGGLFLLALAFFTTGIGFLAMFCGMLVLLIRKMRKEALIATGISLVFVLVYFSFYEKSPVQSSLFAGLSQPVELLTRYFAFIGGILPISALSPLPEAALGLALSASLLYSVIRLGKRLPLHLTAITIFFLLLAAIVVAARFELNEFIANRFKINSAVIFACIVLLLAHALPKNKIRNLFVTGVFLFAAALLMFSYKSYNDYRFWVDEFACDLLNANHGIETTAYQPKGQKYIRASFSDSKFQSVYSGLSEEAILQDLIPARMNGLETGNYSLNTDVLAKGQISRPVLVCMNEQDDVLGYLPVHFSGMRIIDKHGILKRASGMKLFLGDLRH
ncbi:MAG: hypothetical protein R2850_02735 [Bacteroidia bacterium]